MNLYGTSLINSKGHLEIGGVDVVDLVNKYGTPLYVLDENEIRRKMKEYVGTFKSYNIPFQVAYANKALCTTTLCCIAESEGLSIEVVSGGELYTAINAGFPANRIHFHGNNKSSAEIEMGIDLEIGAFVIDNLYEIEQINNICEAKDKRIKALLRVTPGIEAHTHEYIQTGKEDSKFGFNLMEPAFEATQKVINSPWIDLIGFHFHIGSQIFDTTGFDKAIEKFAKLYQLVKTELGIEIPIINTGGGYGISYTSEDAPLTPQQYVISIIESVKKHFNNNGLSLPEIWIEPGRSIIGEAGTTLYRIGSIKDIPNLRKYIAVDGGMMDNPRPALYQAKYDALVANKILEKDSDYEIVTVAGRACESSDILIKDIKLNSPKSGDILAVLCTGAYNYSMASNYNRVARPPIVLVNEGEADIIVKRETYEDLINNDIIPERIKRGNKVIVG
ncbi:MAG: diaminopimelate decarboxylase [Vulcanibacillus sp.]